MLSVQEHEIYSEEMRVLFSLDLDLRPSSILVGEDDNPVDFEWSCEVPF